MKLTSIPAILIFFLSIVHMASGQPDRIKEIFPKGTVFLQNIPYAGDTTRKHLLDIYLPADATTATPLVIWVHGGAWMLNDKYADMSYMKHTVSSFIENGYALASIDYRYSTTAKFPAQAHDCFQAIQFLYTNASRYKLDRNKFALIGFSAGGHLASLVALANNNNVAGFYPDKKKTVFKIRAVLDFYGPTDFLVMTANGDITQTGDPISTLLGFSPLKRPDISEFASPCTYVDKDDPPFFIVHGEKDESVPYQQSILLQSYLNIANVKNELILVEGAPHYGEMFDTPEIRKRLFDFLKSCMN